MATVHNDRNWKIKIYPDDHAPPHFHVQTPDGESLVQIDGLRVLGKGAEGRALKAALYGPGVTQVSYGGFGMSRIGGPEA